MRVKTKCRMGNLCAIRKGDGECEKNCYYNTREVKTNADRIRAMTDEELADELLEWLACFMALEWSRDMILDWLKEEVKE